MSSKSFIAKIAEAILKSNKPKYMDFEYDDFLDDTNHNLPKHFFKQSEFANHKAYILGDKNSKNTILYLHGGAYINEVNYQHLLFCFALSRKLDAQVIVPVYPIAPANTAMDAYDVIVDVYGKLISNDNLIVMGDSAGGGFAHSFCQYLKEIDLPQPDKIITFSPWIDISMSNPPYDSKNDPVLGEVGLSKIAKLWAGNWDLSDYRLSSVFGDNHDLADTLIFCGDNEIFYKDIKKYVENLKNDGVNVELVVGRGLFHVYPLFPIPEAWSVLKKIKEIID